jgi:adenosylmethionine-8-amino-7-oxononanoate aminotransferase
MHAYTYSSHPVGCRVASANLDIIDNEGLVAQAREKGDRLRKGLDASLSGHPHVGEVRGLGLMCAVEIVADKATKEEFPASEKTGARVHSEADKRGLFSRTRGDVYVLAPPVVITEAEIDRTIDIVAEALTAVLG